MIVEPKIRGFICLTAHPEGCKLNVQSQIDFIRSKPTLQTEKKRVLIIGASTGFGLASRIACAYGFNASTIGIIFEREPETAKTATAGWYNTVAFENFANESELYAKTINGDAFSDQIKSQTLDLIEKDFGQVDLVIYSLASPRRTNPKTGIIHKSVLKPIGESFSSKTLDTQNGKISEISLEQATSEEISDTIQVMGGEDWELWIDSLLKRNLLAKNATTISYSYVGPEITAKIYRNGTIGQAKNDLENSAKRISTKISSIGGKAFISVNKALVTQSSSAIPVMPLYITLLYKVMKESNLHEGCIEQIYRMLSEKNALAKSINCDEIGRIRMDDWELQSSIQSSIEDLWGIVDSENINSIGDLEGYRNEFLKLFGFGHSSIDYSIDVKIDVNIPSIYNSDSQG